MKLIAIHHNRSFVNENAIFSSIKIFSLMKALKFCINYLNAQEFIGTQKYTFQTRCRHSIGCRLRKYNVQSRRSFVVVDSIGDSDLRFLQGVISAEGISSMSIPSSEREVIKSMRARL